MSFKKEATACCHAWEYFVNNFSFCCYRPRNKVKKHKIINFSHAQVDGGKVSSKMACKT